MNISLPMQISIGLALGIILGFISIVSLINGKESNLKSAWGELADALNKRYKTLSNLLKILEKYMPEYKTQIDKLLLLCNEALNMDFSIKNLAEKLEIENSINYSLEDVKMNMGNYPDLQNDEKLEIAILEISEAENIVGEAIRKYNEKNLEYSVLIETFPISFVAWILNKSSNFIPFSVTPAEEFDDNYIDEEEVN